MDVNKAGNEYTLGDYLKPSGDELSDELIAGAAGPTVASMAGKPGYVSLAAFAAGMTGVYTIKRVKDREKAVPAARNTWKHWREKLEGDENFDPLG